jgi:outer membrane protein insertion porin family
MKRSLGIFLFLLGTLPLPLVAQDLMAGGISITGNNRVDESAIKMQLKSLQDLKERGITSQESISQDVKTLYQTGFFDQVSVLRRGEVLLFSVVEKPVVRKVFIKGNDSISESDLVGVFQFGAARFLDKGKLKNLTTIGAAYYQQRGFYDAKVNYSIVPVDNNQVDVTFSVTEGDKYAIDEIAFRGTDKIDEDELRDVIETKRYKWWNSWLFGTGRVKEDVLETDRLRLRQHLFDNGLIDGSVSEPSIEKSGDGELTVYFDIKEGPEFRVGKITASGDLLDGSVAKTTEDLEVESNDIFNASKVRGDTFKISDRFGDQGYAFTNVEPDTEIDRSRNLVNLNYKVNKGKKVKIRRIRVKGNDKTYDNVIRRELRVAETEFYSSSKIKRSESLLRRLGFFQDVSISNVPTGVEDQIDLDVEIKEASTASFSAGVAYSSFDGVIFNARVTENNLMGTGRRLDLFADVGSFRNDVILSFTDPRVADSFLRLGVNGVFTQRDFFDFDRNQAGGGLLIGYPFEEVFGDAMQDIRGELRYDLYQNEILNVDQEEAAEFVIESEGTTVSSSFTPALIRNTIDNPLNPSDGSLQDISIELAGAGGDQQYYLTEAVNQIYTPVADTSFGRFTFSLRTRVGYGDTFDDDPFPLFRRYFPGGINSVRGFRNRSLGPEDERGNLFGGSKQFVNNVELIFPLVNSAGLNGVIFYDVGQAFDDDEGIRFSDLRRSPGFGFRWNSPMGPIRVEFGFPESREEGEKGMQTQFSFGAPL